MLSIGDRVAERYEIEALIGQGGLAEVYRVRHIDLGGVHALKLLTWRRKSLAERLLLEGRIQAQLRHPNVVGVTDVVRHEGRFGLLMEYVDCVPLDAYIAEHGALDVNEALGLFAMVLSGMAAAHDAGVLHRDLKPANILLARQPNGWVPKVTDFGIAKVVADDVEASHSTAAGAMMGTPGYMAPEQVVDAADVDARADVFALGVILFELLTGQAPYADSTGVSDPRSTADMEAPPLSQNLPTIDPTIEAAVNKALSRDREDRFDSVRAFGEAVFADHPDLAALLSTTPIDTALTLGSRTNTLQRLAEGSDRSTLAPNTPPEGRATTYYPEAAPALASPTALPETTPQRRSPLIVAGVLGALGLLGLAAVGVAILATGTGSAPETTGDAPMTAEDRAAVSVEDAEAEADSAPSVPPAPAPASTEPTDAPVEAGTAKPSEAAQPTAAPTDATPTDATDPEPQAEAIDEPEAPPPEIDDATDAVAVAEVAPPPEPEVEDWTPQMVGTWKGTANGRPFELRITSASAGQLVGQAVFLFGPSQRVTALRGTMDAGSGALTLTADDKSVVFEGQGDTALLKGTYRQATGKKTFPWSVGR